MKVGVVGLGLIGQKRIGSLTDPCRLTFVCDVSPEKVNEFVSSNKDINHSTDYKDLVASDLVDLVIISTVHNALAPIAEEALNNGKHVLIEKPGAISLGEIERLQALAISQNKILRVGYNHRFHPAFLMARSLLEEEKFGKLLWVRARYGHGGRLGYDKEWRSQKDTSGGGELIDQGSHLLDLLRYLVGEVELVFSEIQTAFWDMEVEDNVYLALRPQVGGFAWLHASWSEWKNTFSFEITLETAKLEITGLGGSYGMETLTVYQMKPEMGPPDHQTWQWEARDSSWDKEMEDILKNINGSPFIGSNVADGIAVLKIIEQVYTNDH